MNERWTRWFRLRAVIIKWDVLRKVYISLCIRAVLCRDDNVWYFVLWLVKKNVWWC